MVDCIQVKVPTLCHVGFLECRGKVVARPIIQIQFCKGTHCYPAIEALKDNESAPVWGKFLVLDRLTAAPLTLAS